MAAKLHYIRDFVATRRTTDDENTMIKPMLLIHHFLVNAGFTLEWEGCEAATTTNQANDGDMELSNTTNWTAGGTATVSKALDAYHSGSRSLNVVDGTGGGTVESSGMTGFASGEPAHDLSIWYINDTVNDIDVQFWNGASWSSVATLYANNATWTNVITTGSGTRVSLTRTTGTDPKLKFITGGVVAASKVYIDDVEVRRTYFLTAYDTSQTDGEIFLDTGVNKFKSASYTFVTGDVGKVVVAWDTAYPTNSGAYKITSVSSGEATLDIRAGADTLTASTGVKFRLVDLDNCYDPSSSTNMQGAGWIIRSPHTSKWTLFDRLFYAVGTGTGFIKRHFLHSSPTNISFSVMDGSFFKSGPSTQNSRCLPYAFSSAVTSRHVINRNMSGTETSKRVYLMVNESLTWIFFAIRSPSNTDSMAFIGFTGADGDHDLEETFVHYQRFSDATDASEFGFTNSGAKSFSVGTGYGPSQVAVPCSVVSMATDDSQMTNAKANQFSAEEVFRPLTVVKDYTNSQGEFDVYDFTITDEDTSPKDAIIVCRANVPEWSLLTDDKSYFHMKSGIAIKWPGFNIIV